MVVVVVVEVVSLSPELVVVAGLVVVEVAAEGDTVVVTGGLPVVEVAPDPSVTEDGVFVVLAGLLPVVVPVSSETPVVV